MQPKASSRTVRRRRSSPSSGRFEAGEDSIRFSREELSEKLGDWWQDKEVAAAMLTSALNDENAYVEVKDWASYCKIRGLSRDSCFPIVLDMPLTVFWAIKRLARKRGEMPKSIQIYCLGAEKVRFLLPKTLCACVCVCRYHGLPVIAWICASLLFHCIVICSTGN